MKAERKTIFTCSLRNMYSVYGYIIIKSKAIDTIKLLTTQTSNHNFHKIDVSANEVLVCMREIEESTGLSRTAIRRAVAYLSDIGFITYEATLKFHKITINC